MILKADRGGIKVTLHGKIVRVPGELFFPPDGKMGFFVDLKNLKHWDFPHQDLDLTHDEVNKLCRLYKAISQKAETPS
jgi:hypothetical protein